MSDFVWWFDHLLAAAGIHALWLRGFLLTVAIEVPLVTGYAPRGQRLFLAAVALAAQLFTHPLAWLAVTTGSFGWWTVELSVVVIEGAVYAIAMGLPLRAFGISLLANAISAYAGLQWLAR